MEKCLINNANRKGSRGLYWLLFKWTISGIGISSAKCLPHKDEDPIPSTSVKVQGSDAYQLAQLNH